LFLLSGRVFGNEKSLTRNVNFQSDILSEGIQVRYDFISSSNKSQVLIPFLSAGIEYIVFHPKSDMKDANGNYYHYWKDGTIRTLEESDSLASQAIITHQDKVYETDLRDANLDGFGKFITSTIAFPIGMGVRMKLSERCGLIFSSVIHLTNTDMIDAISSESIASRKGNNSSDKFMFTSVGIRYDFSAPRQYRKKEPKVLPKIDITHVDFAAISREDADHDGVPDLEDEDPLTPPNVKVDARGRPVDSDNDGVPDYLDQENNSIKGSLVNEQGVTITEEMINEKLMQDSMGALPALKEYLKAIDKLGGKESTTKPTYDPKDPLSKVTDIPKKYRNVDLDFNGVISPNEISIAIDEYLANKSPFSTDEFYKLIDFFFRQH
jgi:hypothetical protein